MALLNDAKYLKIDYPETYIRNREIHIFYRLYRCAEDREYQKQYEAKKQDQLDRLNSIIESLSDTLRQNNSSKWDSFSQSLAEQIENSKLAIDMITNDKYISSNIYSKVKPIYDACQSAGFTCFSEDEIVKYTNIQYMKCEDISHYDQGIVNYELFYNKLKERFPNSQDC